MKIEILKENLIKSLTTSVRIISTKTQLPILQNVLLTTEEGGVRIISTNMETSISFLSGAKVSQKGNVCVAAKLFFELVSSLSEDNLVLEDDKEGLEVKTSKSRAVLAVTPSSEYPVLNFDFQKKTFTFTKDELVTALKPVLFAAAIDDGRPLLTGIKVIPEDETGDCVFAATDGYRLSVKKIQKKVDKSLSLVIPARTLAEVIRFISDSTVKGEDKILIGLSADGQLLFKSDDVLVATRLIDGEFPDFYKIIPSSHNIRIKTDREEILSAVKSASIFARDNSNIVKFQIQKDSLIISANAPQTGSNMVTIDCETEGEEGEIAFNSRFLIDLFNNISADDIVFEMTGSLNPGVFKIPGDEGFVHIIMPVRVQG